MSQAGHEVVLHFSDGVSKYITVLDDQTILDVALDNEIPLLFQCQSGSCSSCMATLKKGHATTLENKSSTLLTSEYDQGKRLLCVCGAQSDCEFTLDYASDVASNNAKTFHTFINSVDKIADNVMRLTVELADGEWVDFLPGQFFQIEVPELGVLRSYSPATTPNKVPEMSFLIRLLPDGAMSSFLLNTAQADDVLTLKGPFGSFFLREDKKNQPHIFVAGGTGLAPILSMIDRMQELSGRKPPMLLTFGCATPGALFSLEDIELREAWLPTLETRICVDREATDGLHLGSPVSALRAEDVSESSVAYLCGPQPMIDAARASLIAFGVSPNNIFAEQFVAS
jgi:benzoate/toluate 1,2-dioxygenase reductase subunit